MGKSWGCTPVWYCAHLWCWGGGGNREWTPMDANGDWEKGYPQMGEGVVGWALTDLPRQGAPFPHFPTAPTAHNEKAQATGLGIGNNNGTGGL